MTIFLVRHAHAKGRGSWSGDDDDRPLTKRGRQQADGLVERFGDRPIVRVLTSPTRRCVDSVAPLASRAGVPATPDPVLAEGADPGAVFAVAKSLAASGDGDAVLCTHGDVIPEVLRLLAKEGVLLDDDLQWEKGSTWLIEANGTRFIRATYEPPPR